MSQDWGFLLEPFFIGLPFYRKHLPFGYPSCSFSITWGCSEDPVDDFVVTQIVQAIFLAWQCISFLSSYICNGQKRAPLLLHVVRKIRSPLITPASSSHYTMSRGKGWRYFFPRNSFLGLQINKSKYWACFVAQTSPMTVRLDPSGIWCESTISHTHNVLQTATVSKLTDPDLLLTGCY